MNGSLLADLVVIIHFGYVLFVVGGLFIIALGGVFRWRFIRFFWLRVVHLAMILFVVFETVFGITCPLTDLEYELRAGQHNAVSGAFVARLIQQLIFYEFPQFVFIIAYSLFGTAVLLAWRFIPPYLPWKQKRFPPPPPAA